MTRIRVVHVSPAHPPTDPRIVQKQVPALAAVYEVICLLPGADFRHFGGGRFIRLPFFRWLGWRLLVVHPLILAYLIWLRPAVLHIYMPELLPIALLCRLFGVNIIYEVQENLRLKFDRKPRNKHVIFRRAFAFFEQLARRTCYHIFTEDSYLTTYPDLRLPHAVIHNYPDPAFFAPLSGHLSADLLRADGPHLLYVGVVSIDRGLDTMLKAVALLKPAYPAIRLHLFGRCAFSAAELIALPAYPDVVNNLVFYGHTDPARAYADANRYVAGLALLKPVGDYPASYPTKLFEYMAAGLPVIASDFALYRAVVTPPQCGFCVDPVDANQVATCIGWLLTHSEEADQMGKQSKLKIASDYNWPNEASQLLSFYEKICV